MPKSQIINELTQYTLPRFVDGTEAYILFYAFYPPTGKMKRKRIKLNYISNKKERRQRANELIKRIYALLLQGWNPWDECQNNVTLDIFSDVLDDYKTHIAHDLKINLLKNSSFKTYSSYIKMLELYLQDHPIRFVDEFNYNFMTAFLDWIMYERENTARTYNNYIGFFVTFCEFLIKRKYLETNPALSIKKIPKARVVKKREIFTSDDLTELFKRLKKHDKKYLLACYMEYYCMIRPNELWQLKISDINLKEQTITVSGSIAKNGRTQKVTLPRIVIELMMDLDILGKPANYYIFGEKFETCKNPGHSKMFSNYWERFITSKNGLFPDLKSRHVCFYSLKGTGITNMLENDIPSILVQKQARHSHLTTTEIYTQTNIFHAPEEIKNYK